MRLLFCAVLCCIYALGFVGSIAMAQEDIPRSPQIAEDTLANSAPPADLPLAAPSYAPVVNRQIMQKGQTGQNEHESAAPQSLSLKVEFNYPELGIASIDSQLAQWATTMANDFQESVSRESPPDDRTKYELSARYTVSRPSAAAVSITYEVWTYTGGAHGNLDIITLNYDTENGTPLSLEHLFNDVEQALELMSTYCYTVLAAELGANSSTSMLKSGTSPDTENFSAITLQPAGIIIHFQPYQVAPWSSGPQKVSMSLSDIANAQPQLEVWGRKEALHQ